MDTSLSISTTSNDHSAGKTQIKVEFERAGPCYEELKYINA